MPLEALFVYSSPGQDDGWTPQPSLPKSASGAGYRMLFPGAPSVHGAFAWGELLARPCLVSCSFFSGNSLWSPTLNLHLKS